MMNQAKTHIIAIFSISALIFSCATIPVLKVTYHLPSRSDILKGKKIHLALEDIREEKDIIGEGARKEFEKFSGNLSLFLAQGKESELKIGAYDVPSIFEEVFKRRLENAGIEVVPGLKRYQPVLMIAIKDFLLDLRARKWVVTMCYEARILKDGKELIRRTLSGEGERYKLVGRGQAGVVMGDILTDMVNQLDLEKLFGTKR